MKTAVIYTTTYGSTGKIADYIADKLPEDKVDVFQLQANSASEINLDRYDCVILGGSVYLGDIQKAMIDFCFTHLNILLKKQIGLFLCGIEPTLIRQSQELEMAFPRRLYEHAQATAFVGGEVTLEELNDTQKFIATELLGIKESTSFIQYDLVDIFIYQMELAHA